MENLSNWKINKKIIDKSNKDDDKNKKKDDDWNPKQKEVKDQWNQFSV